MSLPKSNGRIFGAWSMRRYQACAISVSLYIGIRHVLILGRRKHISHACEIHAPHDTLQHIYQGNHRASSIEHRASSTPPFPSWQPSAAACTPPVARYPTFFGDLAPPLPAQCPWPGARTARCPLGRATSPIPAHGRRHPCSRTPSSKFKSGRKVDMCPGCLGSPGEQSAVDEQKTWSVRICDACKRDGPDDPVTHTKGRHQERGVRLLTPPTTTSSHIFQPPSSSLGL
jgi:hypothetical protein